MKVLVYGTGSKTIDFIPSIALHYSVVGFLVTENNSNAINFLGQPIYSLRDIAELNFDLIIVCSSFEKEIEIGLKDHEIDDFISVDELPHVRKTLEDLEKSRCNNKASIIGKMHYKNLSSAHLKNAKLVENRIKLIELLPKGSCGAEIGVANGDFTAEIINSVSPKVLHLVDIWNSERYGERLFENVKNRFKVQIDSEQICIHRNLSIDAAEEFAEHSLDWVYIDTDHSYNTTYRELQLYSKKVKKGGLIMGHDYVMGNWVNEYKYGVIEAVHRFCVEQNYEILFLSMELDTASSFALKEID